MTMFNSIKELEKKYQSKIINKSSEYGNLIRTQKTNGHNIYDWFPFTQRFTSDFLRKIFERPELKKSKRILDPFMGSGNTLLACLENGKVGYGIDISELFWFIAHVKTNKYTDCDFNKAINAVIDINYLAPVKVPAFPSFGRLFTDKQLYKILVLKQIAYNLRGRAQELLLFAIVSKLLDFSQAIRNGKGLHKKKKYQQIRGTKVIQSMLVSMAKTYKNFRRNMINKKGKVIPLVGDAMNLRQLTDPLQDKIYKLPKHQIDVVLTSPPYCNSSDYIEMYKLEHWFLDFVKSYREFSSLSHSTIRSHLSISEEKIEWTHPVIEDICSYLESNGKLWNPKIPIMIRGYFDDLRKSLQEIRYVLRPKGTVFFIVGNSCYGGVPIPSDLLLAEAAKDLQFKVRNIEIIRKLMTSGQQWKLLTKKDKKILRESLVILENRR